MSTESLYHTSYMDMRVSLSPKDINEATKPSVEDKSSNDAESSNVSSSDMESGSPTPPQDGFSKLLETRLKSLFEKKCNVNGYVRAGSVKILQRSMGMAEHGRFTGDLVYDCKFKCKVLYPTAGIEVNATVLKVNKMGVYAIFEDDDVRDETMVRILLPRDIHLGNEEFDTIEEGDKLVVSLERSKFQTNDLFIVSVGRFIRRIEDA